MRFIAVLLLLAAALAAQPYRPGDRFDAFSTKDQHDRAYSFEGGVRRVIVAFEMGSGKAANAFFETQPADFLARYPTQEDQLTVLTLDATGVITDIRFVDPKRGLPAVFGAGR
jgi:hypothetical protein